MADTTEHVRRLADLFLTRRSRNTSEPDKKPATGPSESSAREETVVEFIIVGHLPVRAGLWLTQYADDVARTTGPTGLVRLDPDQFILEILRGNERAARASAEPTLRDAIGTAVDQVRHWIIRPETSGEVAAMLEAHPDGITILSGADEIAVVAAYRALKDLHETSVERELPLPRISLTILGANLEQAHRAADKIATTAQENLGLSIELSRCVQAMGPLGSTLHFRFPSDDDHALSDLVSTMRGEQAATEEATQRADTPAHEDQCSMQYDDDIHDHAPLQTLLDEAPRSPLRVVPNVAAPVAQSPFDPPRIARHERDPLANGDSPLVEEVTPAAPIRLQPKPATIIEPKRLVPSPLPRKSPRPDALTSSIQGLGLLPVRCPDAEEVELAIDTHGRVHLIAWDDEFRNLRIADAWLAKHMKLVAMACSDHQFASDGPAKWHVVTSEAPKVEELHGTGLRLHLLAPVEVEGKSGWYAAPLNN